MKKILTFTIFFVLILKCYSQNKTSKEIEEEAASVRIPMRQSNSNQVKSITLNLKGVPKNNQGALKDEFLSYKDKIVTLVYDEELESMRIVYKSIIPDDKILFLLQNNNVSTDAIVENR